jgi:hypothetical protein
MMFHLISGSDGTVASHGLAIHQLILPVKQSFPFLPPMIDRLVDKVAKRLSLRMGVDGVQSNNTLLMPPVVTETRSSPAVAATLTGGVDPVAIPQPWNSPPAPLGHAASVVQGSMQPILACKMSGLACLPKLFNQQLCLLILDQEVADQCADQNSWGFPLPLSGTLFQIKETWMATFNIFVWVYAVKYPTDAPTLMKYGDIVRHLSASGHTRRGSPLGGYSRGVVVEVSDFSTTEFPDVDMLTGHSSHQPT